MSARLTKEELERARSKYPPWDGYSEREINGLFAEIDAERLETIRVMAERCQAERERDAAIAERDKLAAALKVAEAERDHERANREECIRKKRNEHERTKEIAAMSKAAGRAEGFRKGVEASVRTCGPRNSVSECIEAIRKLQPPGKGG